MPPKVKIDYARAVELAKAQVALKGEKYVYATPNGQCVNTVEYSDGVTRPSCIVGRIFVAAGVNVVTLHELARTKDVIGTIDRLGRDTEIEVTQMAEYFLSRLQARQDNGTPWGTALNLSISDTDGLDAYDRDDRLSP